MTRAIGTSRIKYSAFILILFIQKSFSYGILPTVHERDLQALDPDCFINEVVGKTYYMKVFGNVCLKMDMVLNGELFVVNSNILNPECTAAAVALSQQRPVSKFVSFSNKQSTFDGSTYTDGWSGDVFFQEDRRFSSVETVISAGLVSRTFTIDMILPSCEAPSKVPSSIPSLESSMRPSTQPTPLPTRVPECTLNEVNGKTYYLSVLSLCLRLQMWQGGEIQSVATTECTETAAALLPGQTLSTYVSITSDEATFQGAFNGTVIFRQDVISEVEVNISSLDATTKTFSIEVVLPSCEAPSTVPSSSPTKGISNTPSGAPTNLLSVMPSIVPTGLSSSMPSVLPTRVPECFIEEVTGKEFYLEILQLCLRVQLFSGGSLYLLNTSNLVNPQCSADLGILEQRLSLYDDTTSTSLIASFDGSNLTPSGWTGEFTFRQDTISEIEIKIKRLDSQTQKFSFEVVLPSCETPSAIPSASRSNNPTLTVAPSFNPSISHVPSTSVEPSGIPSSTPSVAHSPEPSAIPSSVPSSAPSSAPSIAPSGHPSSAPSTMPSSNPTNVPSALPSLIPSGKPTDLPSTKPTVTPTNFPSSTPSVTPSGRPSNKPALNPSASPSIGPSSIPSTVPSLHPSVIPSSIPSLFSSRIPSSKPSSNPSAFPTSIPSAIPSLKPSAIPSAIPSLMPSARPSSIPSSKLSKAPSSKPSTVPSDVPSLTPSTSPSSIPSAIPSSKPSAVPSVMPSLIPSTSPSSIPSSIPSTVPSLKPSTVPSVMPSSMPSTSPSYIPSSIPSAIPTLMPSVIPSPMPSSMPSISPSSIPSTTPSAIPSSKPSAEPSVTPSLIPSTSPSSTPSSIPSAIPSSMPSAELSVTPSSMPSTRPSNIPSSIPSALPSFKPSVIPSSMPSTSPSDIPSIIPSATPSSKPSVIPSVTPSLIPSISPSSIPSSEPSDEPSLKPSAIPSISSIPSTEPTCVDIWNQLGQEIDGEASYDYSGRSVSMSEDGNRIVIGSHGFDANDKKVDSGYVRVFQFDHIDNEWIQIGGDIHGESERDLSGTSVNMSKDGNVVAVGAYGNDGNGLSAGNTRVFLYVSAIDSWLQMGEDIDGESSGDLSGSSVALSSNGTIVAIGSPANDGNVEDSGHVRVFKYSSGNWGGSWTQIGEDIDGESSHDQSGSSVSLSEDGSILAIGAGQNSNDSGPYAGHVRVFRYITENDNWIQIGGDIDGEASFDLSGLSASLSGDGNMVAVGAYGNDGNGGGAGHARIFAYSQSVGDWKQVGGDIDGEASNDFFGHSVILSQDGTTVAIGAHGNDASGSNSGHVRVFHYDQANSNDWIQIGENIDGEAAGDFFGFGSISLSEDGKRLAVGAMFNDGNGIDAGHTRVFEFGCSQ